MRHAQDPWLRLQAQEALMLAADVADMYSIESDLELIDSIHIESPVIALDVMRRNALNEAANLLIRAELLHRELVRRGGA